MNILITGGSSGLGKSIVKQLALEPDNNIYFTYRSNKDNAEQMITQYKNIYAYFCDFSDENSVLSLLSNIPQMDLDVLVNNAYSGYTIGTHFDKTDSFDFLSSFNTNIMPTIRITQEVIKVFKKKRSGKIITILTDALMGPPPIG